LENFSFNWINFGLGRNQPFLRQGFFPSIKVPILVKFRVEIYFYYSFPFGFLEGGNLFPFKFGFNFFLKAPFGNLLGNLLVANFKELGLEKLPSCLGP